MDIGTAIDRLRPGAKYRRYDTYEALVATWEDETSVPSLAELQAAWDEYLVEQQAEAQRLQQLEAAREANTTPLDPADYSSQSALIRQLAQKIAWLEAEIADLRGLV